jgi:hypothetical protein
VVDGHYHAGRGRKGREVTNFVSGLGYCQMCGSKLHYGNGYLRCSLSIQRGACKNNIGFAYTRLESMLLSLGDLMEAVVNLLPRNRRANTREEIAANLEAEIARKREALVQMVRDYVGKIGMQAEAAMTVQDELNSEIAILTTRLADAREQITVAPYAEKKNFLTRFWAARDLLDSENDRERHDARIRLREELRRIIQGIILHPGKQRDPNRFVTVHLKPDVDGNRITYTFSPETLVGIHAALPDGRTALVGPSVLAQIAAGNPKITIRIADDGPGHYQAMTT